MKKRAKSEKKKGIKIIEDLSLARKKRTEKTKKLMKERNFTPKIKKNDKYKVTMSFEDRRLKSIELRNKYKKTKKPENEDLNINNNGKIVYKKQENLIHKNYDNRPVKTDYNLIKDISSVGQGEKKYRKISREQLNKFKHSIDKHFKNREKTNDNFSTTMTKEETLKKNLNRSKSTLLRSISNRKNRLKRKSLKDSENQKMLKI